MVALSLSCHPFVAITIITPIVPSHHTVTPVVHHFAGHPLIVTVVSFCWLGSIHHQPHCQHLVPVAIVPIVIFYISVILINTHNPSYEQWIISMGVGAGWW